MMTQLLLTESSLAWQLINLSFTFAIFPLLDMFSHRNSIWQMFYHYKNADDSYGFNNYRPVF